MLSLTFLSQVCPAQTLLPKGVGIYQLGVRSYAQQDSRYSASGDKVGLGDQFTRDFSGPNLLEGKGGPELKRLAEELEQYGKNNGSANLAESLDLGSVSGEVKADVQARFFGLGFGLNKHVTLFMGVPWIDATVKTSLTHSGANNADAIKGQLGDLAFAELADGLTRASQLSVVQIQDSIEAEGYAPIDEWRHSGFGDLKLGAKTGMSQRLARHVGLDLGLTVALDAPTGYVEDPDILTDVNFGRGYYSLAMTGSQTVVLMRLVQLGTDVTYAQNFNGTVQKRVPLEDESIVAADRRTDVTINPGDDVDAGVFAGVARGWVGTSYRAGVKRHFADEYTGSLDGNYDRLAEDSASYQAYHEVTLSLTSVAAFRKRQFALPFVIDFKAHHPIEARNSTDERYYEASIASFFSTPMAREERPRRSSRDSKRLAGH